MVCRIDDLGICFGYDTSRNMDDLEKTVRETIFLIDLHNIDKGQPQHS